MIDDLSFANFSNISYFTIQQQPLDQLFKVHTFDCKSQFGKMNSFICITLIAIFSKISFAERRIVGGVQIEIEDAPYQVSIQWEHRHVCGGALLSERYAMSAAHCKF